MDTWENAKANAKKDCRKCGGTGVYSYDAMHATICDQCCQHNMGWWKLEKHYGENNSKWCCKAGCGAVAVEQPESR